MERGIFLLVLLAVALAAAGCQGQQVPDLAAATKTNGNDSHTCEADPTLCAVASELENNANIFDDLDKSLITSQEVDYFSGVKGYLVAPVVDGTYPAVILIHEWWGLNDNIRTMADLLAQEGYVVLAIDLYEGEYAETSDEAGKLAGLVRSNPQPAVENMRSAVSFLREQPNVNPELVASMGWCFGGGQSLNLALSGENLAATVIYYGTLSNDSSRLSAIGWPVLGIFGELDTGIPPASVNSFKETLDSLEIENEVYIYPGVGHAFANPSGARYAQNETKDAWEKTLAFFEKNLKN